MTIQVAWSETVLVQLLACQRGRCDHPSSTQINPQERTGQRRNNDADENDAQPMVAPSRKWHCKRVQSDERQRCDAVHGSRDTQLLKRSQVSTEDVLEYKKDREWSEKNDKICKMEKRSELTRVEKVRK